MTLTSLPSILQLTELLLLRDEFLDICEWLWLCECDGLDSAERLNGGCRAVLPPIGEGVMVSIGWIAVENNIFSYFSMFFVLKLKQK